MPVRSPLLAYDLQQRRWQQEAALPEEQISRFLIARDQLWIAGEDPRDSWRWGNLYRRRSRERFWWQQRRLPRFIHAHDLAVHQGRLVRGRECVRRRGPWCAAGSPWFGLGDICR